MLGGVALRLARRSSEHLEVASTESSTELPKRSTVTGTISPEIGTITSTVTGTISPEIGTITSTVTGPISPESLEIGTITGTVSPEKK
jgi:hypothetical protein